MAEKVNVMLVDDLDGSQASSTVTFGLDGRTYEIDLSEANAAKLRDTFATYATAARRTGGRARRAPARHTTPNGTSTGGRTKPDTDRSRTAAIREWAREAGLDVSARGRIPNSVVEAYDNRGAQPATPAPAPAQTPQPKEASAKKPAAKKTPAAQAPAAEKNAPAPEATAPKKPRRVTKIADPFNPEAATA